ncbi:MAG: SRPBCC domain-containing protein [Bacteroidia bacterium]
MESNTVNASIKINATPSQVWEVLTNPEKIALYTGSKVETDWKAGSPISWTGEMQGAPYKNKGEVLEIRPASLLRHTFWTGMGGDADQPENYSEVAYTINEVPDNAVELTYSRTKIATETEVQIFQAHIRTMLEEIKRLSEE